MKTRDQSVMRHLGGLLSMLVALTSAPAAFAQSSSGQTQTVVVQPGSIVKTADLNFGNLIAGPLGGTAVVSNDGTRSVTGGVTMAGGTVTAAEFLGTGSAGSRVRIRGPRGTYTLTRVGGGATMIMRDMTMDVDNLNSLGRGNSGQHTIAANGLVVLRVGGTLDVNANQLPGVYVTTFEVDLNYF
ncbi:MAG: DUF4402 domain-containing protein [Sphingorhabdus sp.]